MTRLMSSVIRYLARPACMMRCLHTSHASLSLWDDAGDAALIQCTASGTVRLPHGHVAWHTERDAWHVYSVAQAAAMLAAKRVSWNVPMRKPTSLDDVQVWIEPLEQADEMPSEIPEVPSRDDGGFSAESLMDPDAWIAQKPQARVPEVSKISTYAVIQVVCRTKANVSTYTEAVAGCLAGCLSLCDAVHAHTGHFPTIENVDTLAS